MRFTLAEGLVRPLRWPDSEADASPPSAAQSSIEPGKGRETADVITVT